MMAPEAACSGGQKICLTPPGIYPWILDCPFRCQDTILTDGPRGRLLWRTENLFNPPGIYPWILDCPFRRQDTILTELSWIHNGGWLSHITYNYIHLSKVSNSHIFYQLYVWQSLLVYWLNFLWFTSVTLGKCRNIFHTRLRSPFQTFFPIFIGIIFSKRSRWPWGLRNKSATARLLVWRVGILLREWIFVCCVSVV
jgi:hypothetical protein